MRNYIMFHINHEHSLKVLLSSAYKQQKYDLEMKKLDNEEFGDFYSKINEKKLTSEIFKSIVNEDYFKRIFPGMIAPVIVDSLTPERLVEDRFYLSDILLGQRIVGTEICLPYLKEINERYFESTAYSRIADNLVSSLACTNHSIKGSLEQKIKNMQRGEEIYTTLAEMLMTANPHLRIH